MFWNNLRWLTKKKKKEKKSRCKTTVKDLEEVRH